MYGYLVVYQIMRKTFNFSFLGDDTYNEFGNASLRFHKSLEELTDEDYDNIRQMICDATQKNTIENYKKEIERLEHRKSTKEDEEKIKKLCSDLLDKNKIMIINMIPKKYEGE